MTGESRDVTVRLTHTPAPGGGFLCGAPAPVTEHVRGKWRRGLPDVLTIECHYCRQIRWTLNRHALPASTAGGGEPA